MSLSVPITNGHLAAGAQVFTDSGAAVGAPPAYDAASTASAAQVQGTGQLSAPHNTPLHVAGVVLVAGLIVAGLHLTGFRFAFDVGMGR
jgi:hypothetical protein